MPAPSLDHPLAAVPPLRRRPSVLALAVLLAAFAAADGRAQIGTVTAHQKISRTHGGFTGNLGADRFGDALAPLGDFDGDGVADLAVGAWYDTESAADQGAVWLLFLNADGTVKSHQKISALEGGFTGTLDEADSFGIGVTALGDLDDDGVTDLAVGAYRDDDGDTDVGAVWILFLNADGTVKAHQKISATEGGFTGTLDLRDFFGRGLTALGDLDGDGVEDLAVGAYGDDDGGTGLGAVWVLFLNTDGTVKSHQKISQTEGGLAGPTAASFFGLSLASADDLDGDGVVDLAVGAYGDDDGSATFSNPGAVWILFLNADGTVRAEQKLSALQGGVTGLGDDDTFGFSVAPLGDLDGDGVPDLAVGGIGGLDGCGGILCGAAWVLLMNADGTVRGQQKISATAGNFTGTISNNDRFGSAVAPLGDLNGDGVLDLAVGMGWDDDQVFDSGAVWILFLDDLFLAASDALDGPGGTPVAQPAAVPAAGGSGYYEASLTNTSADPVTTEVWPALVFPDGSVVTKRRANTVTVEAGATQAFAGGVNFPASLPPGVYTLIGYAGTHPHDGVEQMRVTFDKAAARFGGPTLSADALRDLDLDAFVTFDAVGAPAAAGGPAPAPASAALGSAYPNPFNPSTTIPFSVPEAGVVRLSVFDMLGREVARLIDGRIEAGAHTATFEAHDLSSGTYLVRLSTPGGRAQTQRLTLLK